jgi:tetratricopeptide (TPR) repeat protein
LVKKWSKLAVNSESIPGLTVSKRLFLIAITLLVGVVSPAPAAWSQALLPHTLNLDQEQLEQEGLAVAQDAIQLIQFQELEEALSRAKMATQLAPQAYETWALLGGLYLTLDQPDKGVVSLERALSLSRTNPGVFFSLGAAYFQKGNYPGAVKSIEEGLAIKPNLPEELFNLGNAYLKMNQFPKAIAQYEKAVKQDQKFWPAINNIGLVRYEAGDKDAAIKSWESAIAIDKKAGEPKLALAAALYAQGKQEQAISFAEEALKIDSRYADVKFLKENLWGDRLIADTQSVLATPKIKAAIAKLASEGGANPPQ